MAAKKQTAKDNQKQTAATENEKTQYKIPFITARIDRIASDVNSKIKANASVTIGNHFAVHGIKIYDGEEKGLQVLYPGHKGTGGKFYDDFHPITKESREALNGYVMPMSRKWNKRRLKNRLNPKNSMKTKNLLSSSQCNLFSKFIKSAGLFTDYQYPVDRGDVNENRKNARSPPYRADNAEPCGMCRR